MKKFNCDLRTIYILYLGFLPLIFIQRFAPDITLFGAHFTFNYFYIVFVFAGLATFLSLWQNFKHFVQLVKEFILKFKWLLAVLLFLFITDIASLMVTPVFKVGFADMLKHLLDYALFIFTTWVWWYLGLEGQGSETGKNKQKNSTQDYVQKALALLFKVWAIIFVLDIIASIFQLLDCFYFSCHLSAQIQQHFTSSALPLRHQIFGYYSAKRTEHFKLVRPQGIFGDTNYNGMFLVLTGLVFLVKYVILAKNNWRASRLKQVYRQKIVQKFTYFIDFGLIAGLLILTFSRSALLGVLAFLPVIVLILKFYFKEFTKLVGILLSVVTVFIILLFTMFPNTKTFVLRRLNIGKDPSALTHEKLLNESKTIIKKHKPGLFGNGLGSYDYLYDTTIRPLKKTQNPHSIWIKTYIEKGYLGIVGLVMLFGVIVWYGLKAVKNTCNVLNKSAIKLGKASSSKQFELLFLVIINLVIPYFLIVGTVYYGFYMPFVWVWGVMDDIR